MLLSWWHQHAPVAGIGKKDLNIEMKVCAFIATKLDCKKDRNEDLLQGL
jgi:hypothetical protein